MSDIKFVQTNNALKLRDISTPQQELMSKIDKELDDKEKAIEDINLLIPLLTDKQLKRKYRNLYKKLSLSPPAGADENSMKVEKSTITFKEIIGMEKVKKTLQREITLMINKREMYQYHNLKVSGLLLYGGPGVGKSIFADAISGEYNFSILKPDLASLFSSYVGETPKNIAKLVQTAIAHQPCIIFLDEIDTKIRERSKTDNNTQTSVSLNATTQFLEVMQQTHNKNYKVLFIGATNRVWDVDAAVKRPGRLGELIYIPPPNQKDRVKLFSYYLKSADPHINPYGYMQLAYATSWYSHADIEEICIGAKKQMILDDRKTINRKDVVGIINTTYQHSSLDAWYITSHKNLVGYMQVRKTKGLIRTKKKKEWIAGTFTAEEKKLYSAMIKNINRRIKYSTITNLIRWIARLY